MFTKFWYSEQDKRKNWTDNELKLSVFYYIILENMKLEILSLIKKVHNFQKIKHL